jgi:hypothetical protein
MPHPPQAEGSKSVRRQIPLQRTRPGSHPAHVPPVHRGRFGGQSFPHAPQLSGSPSRWRHWPLQFVSPGAQAAQVPSWHRGRSAGQLAPQAPQFRGSVCVARHTPPQLILPASHPSHAPARQKGRLDGQSVPHPPQFAGSEVRSRHCPLQRTWPPGQSAVQTPRRQNGLVDEHLWLQRPQLSGSDAGSRQVLVPHRNAAGHFRHAPLTHSASALQRVLQVPQWAASLCTSTHPAFPQSEPDLQRLHCPATQKPFRHRRLHVPQLLESLLRSRQLAPQRVRPAGQAGCTHVPALHVAPTGQCCPHAPQLVGLLVRSTHCPPQQVRPAGQTTPQAPHDVESDCVSRHVPLQHDWPAVQACPQLPQWAALEKVATQTPLQHAVPKVVPQLASQGPPTTAARAGARAANPTTVRTASRVRTLGPLGMRWSRSGEGGRSRLRARDSAPCGRSSAARRGTLADPGATARDGEAVT